VPFLGKYAVASLETTAVKVRERDLYDLDLTLCLDFRATDNTDAVFNESTVR
jgi:hypothetical protein